MQVVQILLGSLVSSSKMGRSLYFHGPFRVLRNVREDSQTKSLYTVQIAVWSGHFQIRLAVYVQDVEINQSQMGGWSSQATLIMLAYGQ